MSRKQINAINEEILTGKEVFKFLKDKKNKKILHTDAITYVLGAEVYICDAEDIDKNMEIKKGVDKGILEISYEGWVVIPWGNQITPKTGKPNYYTVTNSKGSVVIPLTFDISKDLSELDLPELHLKTSVKKVSGVQW